MRRRFISSHGRAVAEAVRNTTFSETTHTYFANETPTLCSEAYDCQDAWYHRPRLHLRETFIAEAAATMADAYRISKEDTRQVAENRFALSPRIHLYTTITISRRIICRIF